MSQRQTYEKCIKRADCEKETVKNGEMRSALGDGQRTKATAAASQHTRQSGRTVTKFLDSSPRLTRSPGTKIVLVAVTQIQAVLAVVKQIIYQL